MAEEVNRTSDVAEPFILPSNKTKDVESNVGKRCCQCKCTWKKCGIITAAISVIIVLVLAAGALRWYAKLTGEATSEDADEWNQKLTEDQNEDLKLSKSLVDGEFLLVSFESNYKNYLTAMGIPGFVASMILLSKEKILFVEPEDQDGVWTWETNTDFKEKVSKFRMGERFIDVVGKSKPVDFNTTCTLSGDKNHIMTCEAFASSTGVLVKSVAVFSRAGFIDTRTLVNENVTTSKYYQRVSQLLEQDQEDQEETNDVLNTKIQEAIKQREKEDAENPFSTKVDEDEFEEMEDFKK